MSAQTSGGVYPTPLVNRFCLHHLHLFLSPKQTVEAFVSQNHLHTATEVRLGNCVLQKSWMDSLYPTVASSAI